MKLFRILPLAICFCFALSFPAHAGKDEARKQIQELNQKLQKAGEAGDLQGSIDAAEEVLAVASKEFGEESIEASQAMNNVANIYMYADHAKEAEALYKRVILIETKRYGKKNTALADSYYNLGMAYAVQKKYTEAGKVLDKAYKIRVENFGVNHPESQKIRQTLDELWKDRTL